MVVVSAKIIDATHLELAKPIAASYGKAVRVFIAEADEEDNEYKQWLAFSLDGLQSAYGDSEPEYTAAMVKEPNPEYKL
jgi:hypothetical protein